VPSKERAGVPANGQMVSSTHLDLDHQNTTGNSILNFNQVDSDRDPPNQENTHDNIVLSGLEDAEQNVLLMPEQPSFSTGAGAVEKNKIGITQSGNHIQDPCKCVAVVTSDGVSLNISPSHAGYKFKQHQTNTSFLFPEPTVYGTVPCDTSPVVDNLQSKDQDGNSSKNFSRDLYSEVTAPYIDNVMTLSNVDKKDQEAVGKANTQDKKLRLASTSITPLKRSKRREGSTDEDSSVRAERLKANKNLDMSGMSSAKSFLSFPDARIKSSFKSLGITASVNANVDKGINDIKELEYQRLLEAPIVDQENEVQNSTDGEDISDLDSDFEMDYNAIKHLTGDIAEDPLGMDGSLLADFKPSSRHQKKSSSRKKRVKAGSKPKKCHSKPR
jgi:hypothetical protein